MVTARAHGSAALTGGGYGPEGSAICAMVLVMAFPLVWVVSGTQNIQPRSLGFVCRVRHLKAVNTCDQYWADNVDQDRLGACVGAA